jgi:hypothetical protein
VSGDKSWSEGELRRVGDAVELLASVRYDHCGPKIVGSVVGPAAHQVTLRLVLRPGGK